MMEATLNGPYGQTILETTTYPCSIGRAPDNRVVVNDLKVSAYHAQILPAGQGYDIIDLGSSNGTYVNGQRLYPNVPRLLTTGDQIRFGDISFFFEARAMSQNPVETTVYGGFSPGNSPVYPSTATAASPSMGERYSMPQGGYPPYTPVPMPVPSKTSTKKPGLRALWIALAAIVAALMLSAIAFGVIGYVNRSTPTKTLTAYCSALKNGDFPTAYNQLSSGFQAKYTSEVAFAEAFSKNGGLGKIHDCTVSNVDDGAGTGTISYILIGGSSGTLVVDYTLINENGASKINAQHPRSTPSLTLTTYCSALVMEDYQTVYNQYSSAVQSQIGSEAQFAANATSTKIKDCKVSNTNDSTGTGTVTYLRGDGNTVSANETLIKENGAWKINAQQFVSTPTETLLSYCSALKSQDYQAAYGQLSSTAQSQESEAQFAANFKSIKVTECTASNVNDTAGTGTLNYSISNGSRVIPLVLDYSLVKEHGIWKINSEQKHA